MSVSIGNSSYHLTESHNPRNNDTDLEITLDLKKSELTSTSLISQIEPQPYPIEPQPYQVEPQPYPIEDLGMQPAPEEPFSNFRFDPSRPFEEVLALSSTGEVLYTSKDLEDKLEANRNADGIVEIQSLIPNSLLIQTNPEPLEVIGLDERFAIGNENIEFPFSAIVNLRFSWLDTGSPVWCTGWLLRRSSVITAAHCLYDAVAHPTEPTSGKVTAYPGLNSLSDNPSPYGSWTEFDRWVPYEWIYNGQPSIWDYGVVRLIGTIGDRTGLFSFREFNQINGFLELAGYPFDKDSSGQQLWSGYGGVTNLEPRLVYYSNDTYGGESGSPVWENGYPTCQFCCIAVHSRATGDGISNNGPRVTSYFLYQLLYEREEFRLYQEFLPLIRK